MMWIMYDGLVGEIYVQFQHYFYFPMTEATQVNFKKYAKILAVLRKRAKQPTLSSTASRSCWPTQTSFTLLNNINVQPQPTQSKPRPIRNHSARTLKSTTLATTTPILRLERPSTSASATTLQKGRKYAQPNERPHPQRSLFQCIRQEKLLRLREQKQTLMANIFDSSTKVIQRIDEDQHVCSKGNAINFKTYYSLNKLMDLQEKINQTTNLRPKTSCSQLRKKAR